jgi:hypothetical protein
MKLNLPNMTTFWAAVLIAAVGVIVYAIHLFAKTIQYLGLVGFLLVVVAFILLCLGLLKKGL